MYRMSPRLRAKRVVFLTSAVSFALLFLALFFSSSPTASALPPPGGSVRAIPAFARKYGLPCSSCHQAWPMLSPFGQAFKDNGYQLGNERDAPIYQNPAYWPVTFRITPIWHRENENRAQVDGTGAGTAEANVTTHGFDLSGLDFHTGGTLAKNVSFYVLPSSDSTASFHFETVMARLDNLAHTSWLNLKLGKFELDNLLSEKRILTLTNVAGVYTNYHYQPATENNGVNAAFLPFVFGIGDNQLGMEVMGHSADDRTRYSVALISSNDGNVNLPTSRSYGTFITASQAFQVGGLGLQRIGVFDYIGEAPTYFQFTNGNTSGIPGNAAFGIPGTGIGNRSFYRAGLIGQIYIKKYDVTAMYFHSSDDKYLATGTPANAALATVPLAPGAQNAIWNGALFESHYTYSPQFILIQRVELVRMSQQALPIVAGTPYTPGVSVPTANFGNEDVYTFGGRYYPFMSSRAGFAIHGEYAFSHQIGTSPVSGQNLDFSSLLAGFDFAF